MSRNSHGGKREGAGRKARPDERKVPRAVKLARDVDEYLGTTDNATATIEDAVRRSKGFREWVADASLDRANA